MNEAAAQESLKVCQHFGQETNALVVVNDAHGVGISAFRPANNHQKPEQLITPKN